MQSTSWETLDWKKHKLEPRLPGKINNLKYADNTTVMAEKEEELKSLLMKVKEESEKGDLKLTIQKTSLIFDTSYSLGGSVHFLLTRGLYIWESPWHSCREKYQ